MARAPGADTLTRAPRLARYHGATRRPAAVVCAAAANRTRTVTLFADGRAPGPVDAHTEVRDVEVHTYYVANNSVGRPGWPALRVKSLTESRGAAQFRDEEMLPGVEDLQVEFGVVADGRRPATRFVPPDFASLRDRRVVRGAPVATHSCRHHRTRLRRSARR